MNRIIFIIIILVSTNVLASEYDRRPDVEAGPRVDVQASFTVEETTSADSSSQADSLSQSISEGGNVTNNVTVGTSDASSSGTKKIKNTPTIVTPDIFPTVSCFKGMSGGGSIPGFGISFGGGKIDEDCVKREYIRLAHSMGLLDRATYMWCKQEEVWEDFGSEEDCMMFDVDDAAVATAIEANDLLYAQVTTEEFEEAQQLVEDKNAQQQNQIEDLRRRTANAERRAIAAEKAADELEREQESKYIALRVLQQEIRSDE